MHTDASGPNVRTTESLTRPIEAWNWFEAIKYKENGLSGYFGCDF